MVDDKTKLIYLDNAAATMLDRRVLREMMPYLQDRFYNPSAAYSVARAVKADLEEARHRLAVVIGARSAEIVLTAGATESDNIALHGVSGDIIVSATEHPAVLNVAKMRGGKSISVDNKGGINLAELKSAISDQTELISVGYVNSETGAIADLAAVVDLVRRVRSDRRERGIARQLLLHTDASQAVGICDLNVARLGVDLMTLNAGKCYGPKQAGLLYVRAGVRLQPLIIGGGQEMGLRSGTENVANAVGFAKSLELAEAHRKSEVKRLGVLRNQLRYFVLQEFKEAKINEGRRQSPAILNFSIPGLDGERAVFALDEHGVMVSTGSACAANKGLRSHVLVAMGLTALEADGSIRLSMGRFTTADDIEQLKPILADTIREQLKFGAMS